MSLFPTNPTENLLPLDGTVYYFGKILSQEEANKYYNVLINTIKWQNDEAVIFGKHIITARKVAWYADANFQYTYSNTTKQALVWTKELLELKLLSEQLTNEKYNSCLLNLYHNGIEGMAYHSDDEKALKKNGSIASLSLGAERKFLFKHKKNKQTISILLEHGSLLLMKGSTQHCWKHQIPKTNKPIAGRINLTFRVIQ